MARMFSLMTHTQAFSTEEIILNRELFSDMIETGDYIRLTDPEKPSHQLVLKVGVMQSGRLEISLSKTVADAFNFQTFSRIHVEKVQPADVEVEFVELSFRRQFLQRGNMWRFKKSMHHRPVYIRQNVLIGGVKAEIQELGKFPSSTMT